MNLRVINKQLKATLLFTNDSNMAFRGDLREKTNYKIIGRYIMSHYLSIRMDEHPGYYYPPIHGIGRVLGLLGTLNYTIEAVVMAPEVARRTGKPHCHCHVRYKVGDGRYYKSLNTKLVRMLEDDQYEELLKPKSYSISTKTIDDPERFMRYPLKDQNDLGKVVYLGYTKQQIETQRLLATEERAMKIASYEKKLKSHAEEEATWTQLCDYLKVQLVIHTDENYSFDYSVIERLGVLIVRFYRMYRKCKLPFNINKVIYRYLLTQQLVSDIQMFELLYRK